MKGIIMNGSFTQLTFYPQEAGKRLSVVPKAVPFVKWAGGKRKLIDFIVSAAPTSFDRYLEPFVGGGAVALALNHPCMLLNDANFELINVYQVIRDDLDALVLLLKEHRKKHSEEYFYLVRAQKPTELTRIEQAARFIYLNKTCFNGLYRVNKYGQFNVPFGKYKNPILYNLKDLQAASKVLQNAELFSEDYQSFLKSHARAGDFIYIDPPYIPVGQFSDFKRYTKEQFREKDQRELAQLYAELIDRGAYPVLSNSYSTFALDLYAQYCIQIVFAKRNINHDGTGRNPIPEILVKPR
jgi:DNA adenine methylase